MKRPRSIPRRILGPSKPGGGLVVILRGPIGAGKTTLMRGLEGKPPWRFYALDTDAATSHHPPDLRGEWLDQEWDLEIALLAIHAKLILGRGLNLVLDPGLLLTTQKVDRFLRRIGRTRRDPRVLLVRLDVTTAEAARRKTTLPVSYVEASHKGWVTRPVPGEVVIETSGRIAAEVLSVARGALKGRLEGDTP